MKTVIAARVAAELASDSTLEVHRQTGGLGELRVQVDGTDVVDTNRLWYPTPASVVGSRFQFHREATTDLHAHSGAVFALLDDHRRLAGHMEKPSLMMAGATMKIETDGRHGQAIGSQIRLRGQVLGIALAVDEVVVQYEPPWRKSWETIGEPRLLAIGTYRMGFELTSHMDQRSENTRLRVWIDYNLPESLWTRWLGWMLGRIYADWCTRQMTRDASVAFSGSLDLAS